MRVGGVETAVLGGATVETVVFAVLYAQQRAAHMETQLTRCPPLESQFVLSAKDGDAVAGAADSRMFFILTLKCVVGFSRMMNFEAGNLCIVAIRCVV